MKEIVLSTFCHPEGQLCVIVATSAFGMGIDCSNIHTIIHWGPPCSLEEYVQEELGEMAFLVWLICFTANLGSL